jgi:hypothetical protein
LLCPHSEHEWKGEKEKCSKCNSLQPIYDQDKNTTEFTGAGKLNPSADKCTRKNPCSKCGDDLILYPAGTVPFEKWTCDDPKHASKKSGKTIFTKDDKMYACGNVKYCDFKICTVCYDKK